MDRNISKLFKQDAASHKFSKIKITLASPEKIIEPLDLKKMDFSVLEFLVQLKTMNVYAVNTKE